MNLKREKITQNYFKKTSYKRLWIDFRTLLLHFRVKMALEVLKFRR